MSPASCRRRWEMPTARHPPTFECQHGIVSGPRGDVFARRCRPPGVETSPSVQPPVAAVTTTVRPVVTKTTPSTALASQSPPMVTGIVHEKVTVGILSLAGGLVVSAARYCRNTRHATSSAPGADTAACLYRCSGRPPSASPLSPTPGETVRVHHGRME